MKINNYLNQLKLRRFYGSIGQSKFKRILKNAGVNTNTLGRSFIYFLEGRLDVVLYRANFFDSIYAARQYINHKKVYINGKLVDKPGYLLFLEDIVTLSDPGKFYIDIKKRLENNAILVNVPSYLEVNYKLGSVVLTKLPLNNEVPYPFFINLENITHNFSK